MWGRRLRGMGGEVEGEGEREGEEGGGGGVMATQASNSSVLLCA